MSMDEIPGLVPPDLARVRSFTHHWQSWQGLTSTLTGLWILSHLSREWVGTLVLMGSLLGTLAVQRYYDRVLGLLRHDEAQKVRRGFIILGVFVVVFLVIALSIVYEVQLPRIPQSAFPLAMAGGLAYSWAATGRQHTDLLFGAGALGAWAVTLVLGAAVPHGTVDAVTHVLAGGVLVVHGLRTHFTLMRFVRSMQARAGVGAR